MQGLSDTEQKLVKSTLIEEVEKAVQIIDEKGRNRNGTDIANDMEQSTSKWGGIRHSSSSTMGGIFWGEDSNLATSDNPSSNLFSSNTKNAKEYARLNVNSYFNTVHSQRHIKDPLLWWSNNQNQCVHTLCANNPVFCMRMFLNIHLLIMKIVYVEFTVTVI